MSGKSKMVDAASIDLKKALELTHYYNFDDGLTYKSDYFPEVIDFDELEKIEPPKGCTIKVSSRIIRLVITSFAGFCVGARHYYCDIKFNGPYIMHGPSMAFLKDAGRIIGLQSMMLCRPVTEEDLKNGARGSWEGYEVGDMTNRWDDKENLIKVAKAVAKLRFKNYEKIVVEDETR